MYTQKRLPSDNTAGPFPIGFNYLNGSNITVQRYDADGVSNPITLAFSFTGLVSDATPNGTAILLNSVVPVGYTIVITKVIDMDTPALIWNQGAEITQKNLRKTTTNLMEMAQTAYDVSTEVLVSIESVNEAVAAIEALVPEELLATAAAIASDTDAVLVAKAGVDAALAAFQTRFQNQILLDFGDGTAEKTFELAVTGLALGTLVRVDQVAAPVAGRDLDEAEMDTIVCIAYVGTTDVLTIHAKSITGPVHGQYNFALIY